MDVDGSFFDQQLEVPVKGSIDPNLIGVPSKFEAVVGSWDHLGSERGEDAQVGNLGPCEGLCFLTMFIQILRILVIGPLSKSS